MLGVIDLPTIQKKLNLHYSLSLDLFGAEVSTNAANAFNAGIKGRYHETRIDDDHRLTDATYPLAQLRRDRIEMAEVPALSAINMRLRDDYTRDTASGVRRWNTIIAKTGVRFALALPHAAFHRKIGTFASAQVTPAGAVIPAGVWEARRGDWLPDASDGDFIKSLMKPEYEPGRFAGWIAPPKAGIDNRPGDFEYVKLD